MPQLYREIQQIAYEVPTDHPLPAGDVCDVASDLKNVQQLLNGMTEDARKRVKRVIAVAEAAQKSVDGSKDILKLFLVPEFYFRPAQGGTQRSYSEADKNAILGIFKEVFAQKLFENWVLILGTIIWEQKASVTLSAIPNLQDTSAVQAAKDTGVIIWNTAVVGMGGSQDQKVFNKKHYANVDEIDRIYQPEQGKENDPTLFTKLGAENAKPIRLFFEAYWTENRKNCLVPIGDLTFGLEVCLDHERGVFKSALKDRRKLENKPGLKPDFQVVTACGMRIQPNSVEVAKESFVFRIDGVSITPVFWKPLYNASEAQRVIGHEKNGRATLCAAYVDEDKLQNTSQDWTAINQIEASIPLESALLMSTQGLKASHPIYPTQKDVPDLETGDLKDLYPQRIVIYKPRALSNVDPQ